MTYTIKLVETAIHAIIPYGDKLIDMGSKALGMNYVEDKKKMSKRELKTRIAIANSINQAIKEGRINPSFKEAADEMKKKAKSQLAEDNYEKKQYQLNQMSKATPIANVLVPGLGQAITAVAQAGTIKNLGEYAQESSSYENVAIKTALFVAPLIIDSTSFLWIPFVSPWLGLAAAGVLGSAVVADSINYLRSKSLASH